MKFKYIGDDNDPPRKINFMGQVEFELDGKAVDVKDEVIIAKLKGNKCFSCKAEKKPPANNEPTYQEKVSTLKDAGVTPESRKTEDVDAAFEELAEDGEEAA